MTQVRLSLNADSPVNLRFKFAEVASSCRSTHALFGYKSSSQGAADFKIEGAELWGSHGHAGTKEVYALWNFGEDTWAYANSYNNNTMISFDVIAPTWQRAVEVYNILMDASPDLEIPKKDIVNMNFWYWKGDGAVAQNRTIQVPTWEKIKPNYSRSAQESLDELMNLKPEDISTGRLMLMHGEAGTGKTTAIRALADSWRSWCDLAYIVDADVMFDLGGYLMQVLLATPSAENRWRLIVVEDAEEFITPGAKDRVGQSLARLLNLGDGMIGQGLNVLILMTTNAELGKLHPAVMRPGRCIANIEVPRLSAQEAEAWNNSGLHKESTLAELFEAQRTSQIGTGISESQAQGMYL